MRFNKYQVIGVIMSAVIWALAFQLFKEQSRLNTRSIGNKCNTIIILTDDTIIECEEPIITNSFVYVIQCNGTKQHINNNLIKQINYEQNK